MINIIPLGFYMTVETKPLKVKSLGIKFNFCLLLFSFASLENEAFKKINKLLYGVDTQVLTG